MPMQHAWSGGMITPEAACRLMPMIWLKTPTIVMKLLD